MSTEQEFNALMTAANVAGQSSRDWRALCQDLQRLRNELSFADGVAADLQTISNATAATILNGFFNQSSGGTRTVLQAYSDSYNAELARGGFIDLRTVKLTEISNAIAAIESFATANGITIEGIFPATFENWLRIGSVNYF